MRTAAASSDEVRRSIANETEFPVAALHNNSPLLRGTSRRKRETGPEANTDCETLLKHPSHPHASPDNEPPRSSIIAALWRNGQEMRSLRFSLNSFYIAAALRS
jgi:hypothetical protein